MDVADGSQIIVSQAVHGNLHLFEDYLNKFRYFEAEIKHKEKIPIYQFIALGHRGLNVQIPSKFTTPHKEIDHPAESDLPKVNAAGNLRLVYEPNEGHPFVQSYPGGPTVYRIGVISDREVERATLVANEVTLDGVLHSNVHLRPMHDRDERGTKRVRLSASKMEYWDIVSQDAQGVYLTHIEPIGITAFGIGINKFELMASSGNAPPVTKTVTIEVGKDNTVCSFTISEEELVDPLIEFKPHIEVNPSINQTQSQDPSRSQLSEVEVPKLNFECIRAKMIDVEVDMSSFEILLVPSNGRALERCMAAIAEFRRNTDDSNIDSISIRTIAELKGREGESLSINQVRWLEHDLKTRRSPTISFKRLDTKRLAVVLGISNRQVSTYEGRYVKASGGPAVFHVFRPEFQKLNEAVYDIEIRLMGSQGGKVIVDNTFGFELIRGGELKDSIFRKKNPCLIVPGLQPSKAKQIEQLSRFAEEGDRLIMEYKEKLKPDWTTAKTWGGSTHTYISEYISDESAAYFSLETREHPYPGAAIDRIFVDWVYTRIKRIAEIASEVRK